MPLRGVDFGDIDVTERLVILPGCDKGPESKVTLPSHFSP